MAETIRAREPVLLTSSWYHIELGYTLWNLSPVEDHDVDETDDRNLTSNMAFLFDKAEPWTDIQHDCRIKSTEPVKGEFTLQKHVS